MLLLRKPMRITLIRVEGTRVISPHFETLRCRRSYSYQVSLHHRSNPNIRTHRFLVPIVWTRGAHSIALSLTKKRFRTDLLEYCQVADTTRRNKSRYRTMLQADRFIPFITKRNQKSRSSPTNHLSVQIHPSVLLNRRYSHLHPSSHPNNHPSRREHYDSWESKDSIARRWVRPTIVNLVKFRWRRWTQEVIKPIKEWWVEKSTDWVRNKSRSSMMWPTSLRRRCQSSWTRLHTQCPRSSGTSSTPPITNP